MSESSKGKGTGRVKDQMSYSTNDGEGGKEEKRVSYGRMIKPPVEWTHLDEETYIRQQIAQKRYMAELAAQGPVTAERRVLEAKRELWWKQQDPIVQSRILRRKKMRECSRLNAIKRKELIHSAMFMFWTPAVQHDWVRGAVMDSLKYMHSMLDQQRNKRGKINAHQMDYLRILTNAYITTEDSIFKRIKRKIDLTSFNDGRELRDKDIERAKQRPSSSPDEYLASGRALRAASRGSTAGSRKGERGITPDSE